MNPTLKEYPMKTILFLLAFTSSAYAFDKVEIKSGVSGSYCVPFDAPQCRSFNTLESNRVFEKRQQDRRIEDLERRSRERDLEAQRYREADRTYSQHYTPERYR